MRFLRSLACCAAAAGAVACSSTGGDSPDPVVNTPIGSVDRLNTTLGPLSVGNPNNPVARDEVFGAASAGLTLQSSESGTGFEFVSMTQGDFRDLAPNDNPAVDSVTYNAAADTLTFDVNNGDLRFQDTIGRLMLANPGDFSGLLNDDLAILISTFPDAFPSGQDFDPDTFADNPSGVDGEIERIRNIGSEEAAEYLARLNEIAQGQFLNRDFYSYTRGAADLDGDGVANEQTFYSQFKITGVRSGTTTNYVALGVWNNPPAAGAEGDISYGVTLYGSPTPPGELPDTGTAVYNTTIIGWLLRQNNVEELRGGMTLNVDFARRNVEAQIDSSIATNGPSGETIFTDFAKLSGRGEITNANRFFGDLRGDDDPTLTGGYEGAFYGPNAAEAGGTFTFSNRDVAAAAGFVGPRAGATETE